jgi:acyl-CoA reductase-like NAD-dependent aldehyde dehydrogenase
MSKRPQALSKLQEAVTDGRLANVFFRREQLYRLHEALLQSKDAVVDGIVKDSGDTVAAAFAELYTTLSAIKSYHDQLQPQAELDTEYRIANGQDAPEAREGVGIVLIRPQAHTFVYSVLTPVSAAIAAGNCVAVVVRATLKRFRVNRFSFLF